MDEWLEAATKIASTQDALITWSQLCDAGASDKNVATALRKGWLRREHTGVYAFAGAPRTWDQRVHAGALAAGDGAAASCSCAAKVWEFRHLPYLTTEISVPRERHVHVPGITVHRVVLDAVDSTLHRGVPVTTFERTLIDCSTSLSQFQLLSNLDDGLRRRVASLRAFHDCCDRLLSGPGRRMSVVRWILERRPLGYNPGGSGSERNVLDILVAGGVPAPVQQHRVDANGKTYYLDYAYPQQKLFIEYYGLAWHGTPSAVAYDSERISDLTTLRWQPLIFTDLTSDRVMVHRTAAALGLSTPENGG